MVILPCRILVDVRAFVKSCSMVKTENELASIVVDVCFNVHKRYGPGLLESVYEEILCYELRKGGLYVQQQQQIPIHHEELFIPQAFRADLIVERSVLIELKAVEELAKVHARTTLTYLKLSGLKLGLLINFNVELFRNGIRRIVNNL